MHVVSPIAQLMADFVCAFRKDRESARADGEEPVRRRPSRELSWRFPQISPLRLSETVDVSAKSRAIGLPYTLKHVERDGFDDAARGDGRRFCFLTLRRRHGTSPVVLSDAPQIGGLNEPEAPPRSAPSVDWQEAPKRLNESVKVLTCRISGISPE